uniref:Alcohol dehydrogenase-like C-terminal domain-containing protein n=1 Tax=Timema tahoe TaxID=61484 RepID=A0A7R9NV34_9NEOP|nr:unnamed protein product [Timema tahoe]
MLFWYSGLTVAGTAGTTEGMELVKNLGSDHVFNHREKGYLNNAVAAIGCLGFDVVLENLANVNLSSDFSVLNNNGRIAERAKLRNKHQPQLCFKKKKSGFVGSPPRGRLPSLALHPCAFTVAPCDGSGEWKVREDSQWREGETALSLLLPQIT